MHLGGGRESLLWVFRECAVDDLSQRGGNLREALPQRNRFVFEDHQKLSVSLIEAERIVTGQQAIERGTGRVDVAGGPRAARVDELLG